MSQRKENSHSQQGMTLIMLVFMIGLAATAWILHELNSNRIRIQRDQITDTVLANAKSALLGWAVARGGDAGIERPGEFPCPDNDLPGTAGYGYEDGTCAAGKVGRFPWKTVGIEEPLDGDGEVLWYVVDGAFRKRWGAAPSTNQPINSDTRATMQVLSSDGVTLLTPAGSEAVAVIFSAGYVLSGQDRSADSEICPATGSNIPKNRCSTNYLDVANGINNALNQGPFIAGDRSSSFNDRLMIVNSTELMRLVETRVARSLTNILQSYRSTNGYYPFPARFDDANCLDVGNTGYFTDCQSDATVCQGRFPNNATTASTVDWSGANDLPPWFVYNLWGQTIVFAVNNAELAFPGAGCGTPLTVNGNTQDALILMPGAPLGAIVRNTPLESTSLSDYLDDVGNQDAWSVVPDTQFFSPASTANDKMFVL